MHFCTNLPKMRRFVGRKLTVRLGPDICMRYGIDNLDIDTRWYLRQSAEKEGATIHDGTDEIVQTRITLREQGGSAYKKRDRDEEEVMGVIRMNRTTERRTWLCTTASRVVLLAAAGALMTPVALAQASETIETVVVSGIRESMQSAMQIKQKSVEVVDSVVAEDIGKLSDQNLADTMTRIPGVQGYRYGGEGNSPAGSGAGVTVRGLTGQTSAQLNGRTFSSPGLREFDISNAIPGLVAGIDVYKNQTADHVEGAIGGTINLRTRKPMDFTDTTVSAGITGRYNDLIQEVQPDYFGLASTRWNTSLGEMGLLVAAEWQQTKNRSDNSQTGGGMNFVLPVRADSANYSSCGGAAAFAGRTDTWCLQSVADPTTLSASDRANVLSKAAVSTGVWNEDITRERLGIAAAFQWRPTSQLELTTDAIYDYYLYTQQYRFLNLPDNATVQNLTTLDYNTTEGLTNRNANGGSNDVLATKRFATGTFKSERINNQGGIDRGPLSIMSVSQNAKWTPSDDLEVSGDLSYVRATKRGYNRSVTMVSGPSQVYDVARDVTATPHLIGIAAVSGSYDVSDPRAWVFNQYNVTDNNTEDYSYAAAVDAKYNMHGLAYLTAIKVGARYFNLTERFRDYGFGGKNLTTDGTALNQTTWANAVYASNPAYEGLVINAPTNLYGGDLGYGGGFAIYKSFALLGDQVKTAFPNAGIQSDGYASEVIANRRDAYENTFAGYVMGEFSIHDDFVTGNLGVRVVGTADKIVGMTANDGTDTSKGYSPTTGKSWYVDVMPSANVNVHWTDDLLMRLAWSKGVTRPSLGSLNPAFTFAAAGADQAGAGNPNLKATTAYSYDVAFEYYFDTGAYLAIDFWDKEIEGFITTVAECQLIAGHTPSVHTQGCTGAEYMVSSTMNGGQGYARGIEVSGQTFFTFLPGIWQNFGTSVSYAYMDTQNPTQFVTNGPLVDVPMAFQSKNAAAVSLLYEDEKLSGRLVYTYRSDFILFGAQQLPSNGRVVKGYGILDAALNYELGWGTTVSASVSNITAAVPNRYIGEPGTYSSPYLRHSYANGRVYSLGLRFKTGD